MKKLLKNNLLFCAFLLLCHNATCAAGLNFNVTATGAPANVSLSLCLNGKGPLSCQNYEVQATSLSIRSNIPNHTYPFAGIKVNTPGFAISGCTMNSNGYCLFAVSDTQPAILPLTPSTCQPSVISFIPQVIQLNNNASQFTLSMTMCNSQGQPIIPSADNPIHVALYGAPAGAITPAVATSTNGSLTFSYNGQVFPNNISINAWISDSTNKGAAIGVTQILAPNTTPSCNLGSTSYQIPLASTLPNALQVNADVGYSADASTDSLKLFTLDTGSLGVIVPTNELAKNPGVIGPGAPGVKYYDSSGNTYAGHYYLAPVRLKTTTSTVQTAPILVLGIDSAYCTGPKDRACYSNPPTPDLRYIGVGFNRNSTTSNDLFNSPTANAFLHLTNAANGTDITPGYSFTPNDNSSETGLTLGITSTTGYDLVSLAPNPSVAGDFSSQPGCYSFTDFSPAQQFCGTALLDIGIDYMFIDLPRAQWPAGTYGYLNHVPQGFGMTILMGATATPAMQYHYVTNDTTTYPAAPLYAEWIDSTATGEIFVNTGRRPLYDFDYLYNGQCGQVGFKRLQ